MGYYYYSRYTVNTVTMKSFYSEKDEQEDERRHRQAYF